MISLTPRAHTVMLPLPAPCDATLPHPTMRQRLDLRQRPAGQPVMFQDWSRLLFLHWRMPADLVQSLLPPGLTVDTFDGDAWVGIVPFFMRNIRIRGLPPIPTATNFLELNLRTYAHDQTGTPGVWFISLDTDSWLTVQGARAWFRLPYHSAHITAEVDRDRGRVDYRWRRRGTSDIAGSRFIYQPRGPLRQAEPEGLEFFLLERYLLFAAGHRSRLFTSRVSHEPYQFADAELGAWDDRLALLNGLPSPGRPPDHAVISPGVSVDVFRLTPIR